ncbi:oxygen-independent coproporphyrinogen-3 oxidase [Lachnospiraceae bacterium PM6-15]|uniref:radical SAM family heme chaperone HemW n=1 Tax=Ohessyouella blattaphilus TaxID=2949333 RepID=UPI002566DEDA|nr:radical SAM family heme chaperone HemW [Lachnospiraceae bacterium OttesenSCG-928-J05]
MITKRPLELYLHIPFCVRKCHYCDFPSGQTTPKEQRAYVEDLCHLIREQKTSKTHALSTIFVGGGTPSLLTAQEISSIFAAIRETFEVVRSGEITIEVNPGTVSKELLACYQELGINRLSIGLQSTNDDELKTLGRIHTYQDFLETYESCKEAGFKNVNVDLMFGIPGQTVSSWERSLRQIAELDPQHISAYSLIVEEGTKFSLMEQKGELILPSEDVEREMYKLTKNLLLEYGFHRYEISNYAKAGYECRHNLGYWQRKEYLGLGYQAASLIDETRFTTGGEPVVLSVKEQMEETMFLGLRMSCGVDKEAFFKKYGCTLDSVYGKVLEEFAQKELLINGNEKVYLTEKGLDLSNYVMSEFLLEDE